MNQFEEYFGLFNYWIVIMLMMVGFYVVIAQHNLVKKIIGLNIFQVSVFVFYISMGKVRGGSAPIIDPSIKLYSNPLPHVLILTAIVVGVATTSLGLALVIRIRNAYGTIEEDEIEAMEAEQELVQGAVELAAQHKAGEESS
jgi:multicomponent Na+:H+ antiporter subunit C